MPKDFNMFFTKVEIQETNKHTKRFTNSLTTRRKSIKNHNEMSSYTP